MKTTASSNANVLWIPYAQDPTASLARTILAQHSEDLPDLSRVVVLLNEPQAVFSLRRHLLSQARQQGHAALLAPRMESLWSFLSSQDDVTEPMSFCDDTTRELILIEALQQHPLVVGKSNPWVLAEHLLRLFDELTFNQQSLPSQLADFTQWLQRCYQTNDTPLTDLSREAELVHTLWLAWRTELQQHQRQDKAAAYTRVLGQPLQTDGDSTVYYAAGIAPHRSELEWIQRQLETNRFVLCLHGQTASGLPAIHPDSLLSRLQYKLQLTAPSPTADAYSETLDQVYANHQGDLITRATRSAEKYAQSPLQDRLSILLLNSAEQEARAADIQIRRWLLQGKTNIAVVCENRRLSRRLRALLERANVTLQDATGWALSTTSASTTLERWLECIEEEFAYQPLLDLLASVFIFRDVEPAHYKRLIYRFEQDIILNENIARGLQRYRNHIRDRSQRIEAWQSELADELIRLLDHLETAATPLLSLLQERQPAATFVLALQQSLEHLGVATALQEDAAGRLLLQELEHLRHSAANAPLAMDWLTFRTWLGRHLEQVHFRPTNSGAPIKLMGLAQTQWQSFDALLIAGAEQAYLPGSGSNSPFFNDSVRQELQLPCRADHLAERFYHFRRLLESAPEVVITACQQQDGEPIVISPWLERLLAFHKLAWGDQLHNVLLQQLLTHPGSQVSFDRQRALPTLPRQPSPVLTSNKLPGKFSASDYQQLLDCPYQYFAARSLSLSAPEEVRLALSKADYGSRIHQCLDAFFTDRQDLPGPFRQALTVENRQAAIDLLNDISTAVFARDLRDHFSHHGWLQKWQSQIPAYIDWEIARAAHWQVKATEKSCEVTTSMGITLKGRVDRLDQQGDVLSVVDYKTGNLPKSEDVQKGEKIQLPFYALLLQDQGRVEQVSYLPLNPVASKFIGLQDVELQQLSQDIQTRLDTVVSAIAAGEGLPAWGDTTTCSYCDMNRLCRRQSWEYNDNANESSA